MFARYGFFGFFFGDVVRFGRKECDEFNATFYQKVPGIFCKRQAIVVAKDFSYYLSDSSCKGSVQSATAKRLVGANLLAGTNHRFHLHIHDPT